MEHTYTENDYKVLKAIIERNNERKGLCKGDGTTITELIEKTGLSEKKIRLTLKRFNESAFVTKGVKKGRAETYILTILGVKELNSLRTNIFEGDK